MAKTRITLSLGRDFPNAYPLMLVHIFNELRDRFTHFMQMRAVRRHGSRVGWRIAPRYTRYLQICRANFRTELPPLDELSPVLEEFKNDGVTSYWTPDTGEIANSIHKKILQRERNGEDLWGDLGASGNRNYKGDAYRDFPELEGLFRGSLGTFLINYFRANFKLYYASMFKSVRLGDVPGGSQIWHSDSGPGSCVIVLFYLNDVLDEGAGVLHALPWRYSKEIFKREYRAIQGRAQHGGIDQRAISRNARRELLTTYYTEMINTRYRHYVRAPKGKAGLVVPFLNNILHFGGNPDQGRERIAVVAHCYPSDRVTDYGRYRQFGASKAAPYPLDPAELF